MLDKIRAIALEKLGSEEAADAFMQGFENEALEKAAAFYDNPAFQQTAWRTGGALAGSILGAGIVAGVAKMGQKSNQSNLRARFDTALAHVVSTNKYVKGSRPEKVKEFAETLFRFAPNVVSDPNILGMLLSNSLQGEAIDVNTVKTLVELEGRYKDNNKTNPIPSFRA